MLLNRVSKHSEIIERARQTVDETVEVGNAITEQLKENRERIEHATDNVRTFQCMFFLSQCIILLYIGT